MRVDHDKGFVNVLDILDELILLIVRYQRHDSHGTVLAATSYTSSHHRWMRLQYTLAYLSRRVAYDPDSCRLDLSGSSTQPATSILQRSVLV